LVTTKGEDVNSKQAQEFYQEYLNTIYVERKVEQLGRFFAPEVVAHPVPPGREPGLPGVRAAVQGWVDAFADLRFTVDSFVYDNGIMAPRLTISGTHVQTFLGIPPTGKRFQIIDHPHYQLRDGKVVELWDVPDLVTLLLQLGVNPFPQAA
jgi:predicted ester cyclase